MWPFNQYRVLKINVTRNIYHKAPDVHIFHIIDEKKTRWEKEQVPVRPLHWNSFSVYHHDWNDRTFRHVAAKRIAIVITRFEAILTCFYSFLQCCCCCCLFFFFRTILFLLSRHHKWKCKPANTESPESGNHKKTNILKASPRTRSVR